MKRYKFKLELEGEIMADETLNISLTVNPVGKPFLLTDAEGNPLADGADISLTAETVGVADPGQVVCIASGGTGPYSVSLASGSLPDGDDVLSTDNEDGTETFSIAGTPTTAGDSEFSLTFADSAGASVTLSRRAARTKSALKS